MNVFGGFSRKWFPPAQPCLFLPFLKVLQAAISALQLVFKGSCGTTPAHTSRTFTPWLPSLNVELETLRLCCKGGDSSPRVFATHTITTHRVCSTETVTANSGPPICSLAFLIHNSCLELTLQLWNLFTTVEPWRFAYICDSQIIMGKQKKKWTT